MVEFNTKRVPEERAPTFSEIRQVLDTCENNKMPKHRMVIMIGYFLGLRRQEITGLKVKDVNFWRGEVYIREEIAKGEGFGYIQILSKRFTDELQDYIAKNQLESHHPIISLKGKPYTIRHIGRFARQAFDLTAERMDNKDFRKYHTHTLRHGYGRWMEENRYPPKFIRAQLRHRKTSTSQDMYGHFNRDDLQRMAATGPKQEW